MSILDGPGPVGQPVAQPAPQVTPDPLNPTVTSPQQGQSGFLNDLGVDWAGLDVANEPGAGTYRCFLVKSEIRTKKDDTKSWVFSYKVAPGQPEEGKTKDDWRPLPQTSNGHFASEKDATFARFLKQRLMELGVPEERIGSVVPKDLQGLECFVTITVNGQYKNVTKVVLASEVENSGLVNPQAQQVQGLI
jgi:hypothetical protein